ncbi:MULTISPECIES: V-type ATPase subunit [unclassified Granulicatella]|uniref:V-type ATPase subunit n=1 Tax=unclassified Granulicatella TaxID=2630493 RepID=UPI0010732B78|nr:MULTISPECIES: V-type ATPase subunit [unclassified Granulicatella]MBF0780210.1 V-type ATPase subunit [Granulicatella sp. 19428wC4_WM01]TFU95703.1 hypothetical protein E4T68_03780 [Granulicatella sp. WM01]
MNDTLFASVNTLIRIKEQELLSKEQLDTVLKSHSTESAISVLKSTRYADITVPFEHILVEKLADTYRDIVSEVPVLEIVDIFSLIYSYHNLKVLLKTELAGLALEHLVIPIGRFSVSELTYAIKTSESDTLPSVMLDAIQHVKDYYEEYGRIEAIDILLDRAYFQHLNHIAKQLHQAEISAMIYAWTDLYNINCLLRVKHQSLSRSFLLSILSEHGQIALNELIHLALNQQYDKLVALLKETDYAEALDFSSDTLQALHVERMRDLVANYYLKQSKYEPFGLFPVLSFLYYTEMEVKNLRLLLTGKENNIDETVLRERMRPIYGL